jgi:hypothetical protein
VNLTIGHKIRRRTALPEELLYPIISSSTNQDRLAVTELPSTTITQEELADSNMMPLPLAGGIVRVPSAPGSLKYVWPKVSVWSVLRMWVHSLLFDFLKHTVCERPPLWSCGQSSWLQIRRPGFDSRHYQIFQEKKKKRRKTVVGLEQGPLSLVSTTEELLDRKVVAPV